MENLSNMCICLHGSGARKPPYTHYFRCPFARENKPPYDAPLPEKINPPLMPLCPRK